MKLSKRLIGTLLATIMLMSVILTGCGNKGTTPTPNPTPGDGDNVSGDKIQFSYLMHSKFIDWLEESKWYPYLLKNTNAEIEFVAGGSNDSEYYSSVDQRIISKTFPDTGIVSVSQAAVYGDQGAFVDLKPYIEKHGPNIQKYINDNPDYAKMITSADGAIYGIVAQAPKFADFIFYRQDMFEKAGITSEPTSVDEFTDALRSLKAFYGKDNANYYPFVGREGYIRFQAYFNAEANFDNGVSNGIYGNGKTGTDLYSDGYKQMVEWYKTLYNEGLIDPEWVAGAGTEEAWEMKMLTGLGSVSYDYYTRPAWFMDNGGKDNDPDYQIAIMSYPKDINGNPTVQPTEIQYNILRSMVVNKTSEDKAEGVVKFLDYLFSEEGQTLVQYGVEGESYKVENGEKVFIVDYSTEESTAAGTPRWTFLADRLTFSKPMDNAAFYKWNSPLVSEAAGRLYSDETLKTGTIVNYTSEQSKEMSNLNAAINDAVTFGVTQFVTGKRPMTDWDTFLGEIESLGYKRVVEIQQEAYDAMYK